MVALEAEDKMAITVTRSVANLTAANYTPIPVVVDPADGTVQTAYTTFEYDFPDRPARTVDGQLALADPNVMTLKPRCIITTGATMTPALLAHEQFHYDVGFVVARRFVKQLMRLRAATYAELSVKFNQCFTLHIITRVGLLQRRYDLDTHHGTIARYQRIWTDRMAACLRDSNATQLGGFWL